MRRPWVQEPRECARGRDRIELGYLLPPMWKVHECQRTDHRLGNSRFVASGGFRKVLRTVLRAYFVTRLETG